ncbi:uncharacterized protein EV422DRAFT_530670 [Fimicolochytrium jonesii]|uniref:uncharacterized protein n=1 Tax=Fimicolochytrium jonesii TaxID=1396493 RepID=UPI0022FE167E|nr:uncharacterized protein EV422DRAFT_530670 [Fimicolochytrium jonesii]KAI8820379.1 hypothetical protein EV422DRAFT_530670 [Fimicolochytrium jonesii]
MSCCGSAKWKREQIEDHKFDLLDVEDFVDNSLWSQVRYSFVFVMTLKSVLLYMLDLGTVILLITNVITSKGHQACASAANFLGDPDADPCAPLKDTQNFLDFPIEGHIRFALILSTTVLSYLLLAWEWKKGMAIVKSKDISYAFTNTVAYRYYVVRSYGHFCLFTTIEGTRRMIDELAFWVFFTFRGWKRLLLSDFPRQFLNFLLIWEVFSQTMNYYTDPKVVNADFRGFCESENPNVPCVFKNRKNLSTMNAFTISANYILISASAWKTTSPSFIRTPLIWTSMITVLIWSISFLMTIVAALIYIPLLMKIRGNLKEYCCHKVDKRIDEILKKKSRKRAEAARKKEEDDLKKYGKSSGPRPTLPTVDLDVMSNANYSSSGYNDSGSTLYRGDMGTALYDQSYAALPPPPGPGSAYGGSNGGSSSLHGSQAYGRRQPSPLPPMPNPYVRALAHNAPGSGAGYGGQPVQEIRVGDSMYDQADMASEYGGSQPASHYSGGNAGGPPVSAAGSGFAPPMNNNYAHHPHPQPHPGQHPGYYRSMTPQQQTRSPSPYYANSSGAGSGSAPGSAVPAPLSAAGSNVDRYAIPPPSSHLAHEIHDDRHHNGGHDEDDYGYDQRSEGYTGGSGRPAHHQSVYSDYAYGSYAGGAPEYGEYREAEHPREQGYGRR